TDLTRWSTGPGTGRRLRHPGTVDPDTLPEHAKEPAAVSGPHHEQTSAQTSGAAASAAEDARALERAVYEVKKVVVGQDRLIELILVGLLSKGHILLEGLPGVAKTLTGGTFARVSRGRVRRLPRS